MIIYELITSAFKIMIRSFQKTSFQTLGELYWRYLDFSRYDFFWCLTVPNFKKTSTMFEKCICITYSKIKCINASPNNLLYIPLRLVFLSISHMYIRRNVLSYFTKRLKRWIFLSIYSKTESTITRSIIELMTKNELLC